MVPLTIVVAGYNRHKELALLLDSLSKVETPQPIDLVISIDNKGTQEVNEVAESFSWGLGKKIVTIHQEKLGLVNHFIWVGDQSEKYEHVLFIEDDMYVSPEIINYSLQVIPLYEDDDRIAGCSLYDPHFTLSWMFFDKVVDGYDNYFYQHPYWGNIWYKNKWRLFKDYLKTYTLKERLLPPSIRTWKTGSFKQIFLQYLVESKRTMVFPRVSLLTNVGAAGLHMGEYTYVQSPICARASKKKYLFSSINESLAIYDVFEELTPNIIRKMNPVLDNYDFVLDTKCIRDYYDTEYVLTNKKCANPIFKFDGNYKPVELSAIMGIPGEGLYLCHREDIREEDNTREIVSASWMSHINMESISTMLKVLKTLVKKRIKNSKSFY